MFVEIEKLKIYYENYGKGTPIILIHGHGESTYIWRYMVESLSKIFCVYSMDLIGFGYSDKPLNSDYSIRGMSKLVIDFMDELQIKEAILVCHSFAGKIGISTIINNPKRIIGLVLLGCAIGKFKIWKSFQILQNKKLGKGIIKRFNEKIATATLKRLHDDSYEITKRDICEFLRIKENEGAIHAFQSYFIQFMKENNYIENLEKITIPTLVIWGENDKFISINHGEFITENIKKAKLEIIEKCGHSISEDQPEKVSSLIVDFFKDL